MPLHDTNGLACLFIKICKEEYVLVKNNKNLKTHYMYFRLFIDLRNIHEECVWLCVKDQSSVLSCFPFFNSHF